MKKLIIALLACVLGATAAQAQKTKAEITSEISTLFPDNSSGQITPLGLRTVTNDLANSIMPTAPVISGNLACFNGTTGLLQDCGVAPSGIYTALSGDCTATLLAVITCTKTNGTATNDNAAAGEIGEYTECALAQGSATSLTTNTAKDVCTVSLTAGDWDVSGAIGFLPGASTSITVLYGGWSTVANTADTTAGKYFQQATAAQIPTNIVQEFAVPTYRFSLSGTTTVRLIGLSIFTASTNTAFGLIRARRVR